MDVKTAGRTMEVFEAFARAQEPLSLSELSRELQSPLSSCLYLVRTLENLGYLYGVGARRNLYPTRKMLDIAKAISEGEPWIKQIEPVLVRLRDETRETVILSKLQGKKVVYLAVHEGPQTIRYSAKTGDLKLLHSTSSGKALLSAMPAADRTKLISKLAFEKVTDASITDRKVLLDEIKKAASLGYASVDGENVPDVFAIAKPIWVGTETYALTVAGPTYRMKAVFEDHVRHLTNACVTISAV